MTWIDHQIPGACNNHRVTSPASEEYNCIAWAASCDDEWWTYLPGYKWPASRSPLVESLVEVFVTLGFEQCANGDCEDGFDKVAIYARGHEWKHAARQLSSGKWTSKLGPDEDIEHDTADCLCGTLYGQVHCYMRRAKP